MPSRLAKFAAAFLLLAAASLPRTAQDLPNKPIRMVIAFPAGGPTDFVGRLVADKVKDILGRTVIIENKAGANGAIGADYVAKSPSRTAPRCSSPRSARSRSRRTCAATLAYDSLQRLRAGHHRGAATPL